MAKKIYRILDDLSPSEAKLRNLPRKPNGLYNMHLNEYGQLEKRLGYAVYNTTSIGAAHKITGMHRFYKMATSSKEFLVAWNTSLYKIAETTPWGATKLNINERHTQANAASDPNSSEANATTGWVPVTAIYSVTTDPQTGTYHLKGVSGSGSNDYIYKNFTAVVGKSYYVSIWAKRGAQGTQQKISGWQNVTSSPNEAIAAGDWAEYTYTVTASTTNIQIRIYAAYAGGASGDEVYIDNVSITELLTADKDTYFADFYNHCYIVNGSNTMMKYNMTNVRTVGMTVPIAATGSATGSGDLTAGNYYFKVTYVDEDGYESNGGAASAAIVSSGSDTIVLVIPVSADAKVAKRYIYRTTAGGSIYYYDGEVANNSGTGFTATQADTLVALNSVLHTDHTAPPADPSVIAKRRNRLYIGHDSEICISHLSDRDYFPAAWFIYTGNRGKVRGLIEAREDLAVLTDDSLERLTNYDEDSFEMHNSFSSEGCIATRSLVNCDNLICYLGFDGIYYFDGVMSRRLNTQLNEYIKDNIVAAYASLSCAVYWDNKYILCYPKTGGTYPTETVYYDFINGNYGVYSFAFSCFSKWDKGSDGLKLKAGSNTIGQIYSVFSGLEDDTAAITCYDKPEPIDFGKPEIWKQFYHIYIKVKSTTGTALRFYYTLDAGSETYKDLTLTANKTLWYKIDLVTGGQLARAITIRPYVSDKYAVTYMGYALAYEEEPAEYA